MPKTPYRKQNEKINLFIEYSHLAMTFYVTDDEYIVSIVASNYMQEENLTDNHSD